MYSLTKLQIMALVITVFFVGLWSGVTIKNWTDVNSVPPISGMPTRYPLYTITPDMPPPATGVIPAYDTRVTIEGTVVCLPHKPDTMGTLECAMGLMDDQQLYYGLIDSSATGDMPGKGDYLNVGDRIGVTGIFRRSDERNRYNVVGIIHYDYFKRVPPAQPTMPPLPTMPPVGTLQSFTGILRTGEQIGRTYCSEGIYIDLDENPYNIKVLQLRRKTASGNEQWTDTSYIGQRIRVTGEYPVQQNFCEALICQCEDFMTVESITDENFGINRR